MIFKLLNDILIQNVDTYEIVISEFLNSGLLQHKINLTRWRMNRASLLLKSVATHKRKVLLASGTTLAGSSYISHATFESHTPVASSASLRLFSSSKAKCEESTEITKPIGPVTVPIPTREEQLKRLKSGEIFDVLVIGGGATGAGAALDAASRGLSTALIERGDFGNETSSRSTKLIWAGIRYIATAISALLRVRNVSRPVDAISDFVSEYKMVLGAHKERRILLENNPHLSKSFEKLCFFLQSKYVSDDTLNEWNYSQLGAHCHSILKLDVLASSIWSSYLCLSTYSHASSHEVL